MEHTFNADQNTPQSDRPESRNGGKVRWPVIVSIILLISFTVWFVAITLPIGGTGHSSSSSPPAEIGDTRIVASNGIACAATVGAFNAFLKAADADDKQGISEALAGGAPLTIGTKIIMIDQVGFMPPLIKLRILTGPDTGRTCWTDESAQGLFR